MNDMSIQAHSFQAGERLKLRKNIETLFQEGEAFSVFPIRIIYRFEEIQKDSGFPAQVGFSVPKKKFSKAVHRNLLKRRLREAWRLNKHILYNQVPSGFQVHCFLIYTHHVVLPSDVLHSVVVQILDKLAQKSAQINIP